MAKSLDSHTPTPPILPPFKVTPIERIDSIVSGHHAAFASGKTRPLQFRLAQLRRLYWSVDDHTDAIIAACKSDLGKGSFEAVMTEAQWVKNDILFVEEQLEKWMKDEKPADIDFSNKLVSPRIRKDPLGTALVIGAFNFPFQLALGPMIGAIAAGCCCVLKPSENAPASAAVLEMIVYDGLDHDCYSVVNGGIPQSTALLESPIRWDSIFYTGSDVVGKIVAVAAAKTLTPVTLELGGRNPAFVTANADTRLAARRLLWAKAFNAGQVCVGQNWVLVHEDVLEDFKLQLKIAYNEFFPNGAQLSPDYGRIINERAYGRLIDMLDRSHGEIIVGGERDPATLFIGPTVVQVDPNTGPNDSLVTSESFGPFIPIIPYKNLDAAIRMANDIHSTPLAIYPFGSAEEVNKIVSGTRSGGVSINDGFFHACIPTLEFGGVGTSGSGAYRGRASFDNFTHRRAVTQTPGWMESFLSIRYPPYTDSKIAKYKSMSSRKPGFDRDCNPNMLRAGTAWYYLALGATSFVGLMVRYAVVLAVVASFRARQSRL